MSFSLIALVIYILIMLFYSKWLYDKIKCYYTELMVKTSDQSKPQNIHDLYPEFQAKDELSFIRIYIGSLIIFPAKIIPSLLIAITLTQLLKLQSLIFKKPDTNPYQRKTVEWIIKTCTWLFLKVNGIILKEKNLQYEQIYKKYLGPNYTIDINDKDYSLIICNHIGFFEDVANMFKYQSGFIAKNEVKDFYFIGPIAQGINCLFVKRESREDRNDTIKKLKKRQEDYINKKTLAPLCLYPEGTTSSGRHILRMKRGAFFANLPIKPIIVQIDQNEHCHIASGGTKEVFNYLKSICYLYHYLYYNELPIIKPTSFMYENYAYLGNEKWEIFANVVRKMYSEIGGFKESDKGYLEKMTYQCSMESGKYILLSKKNE